MNAHHTPTLPNDKDAKMNNRSTKSSYHQTGHQTGSSSIPEESTTG